jgi:Transposase C of IS166 homeodomain
VIDPFSTPVSEAEQIGRLERKLAWAEERIRVLEEILRLQRIKKYGPGSEKLTSQQLELLELEPGVSHAEVQAESRSEPLSAPAKSKAASINKGSNCA